MSQPTPSGPPTGDSGFVPPLSGGASYQPPTMPDITDLVEGSQGRADKPSGGSGLGRNLVVGGVIGAVVIAGGAFFAGRAMAAGPATLADALQEAQAGTLPCGTTSGTGGGGFAARLCAAGTGGGAGTGGTGTGVPGGAGFGGRGVVGTVTAVSPTSITVNTRGGSVTVAVPSTVVVSKTVTGAMSDVTVGADVTVASTTDASGNRTASRITIVPAGALTGGFGGGPGA